MKSVIIPSQSHAVATRQVLSLSDCPLVVYFCSERMLSTYEGGVND